MTIMMMIRNSSGSGSGSGRNINSSIRSSNNHRNIIVAAKMKPTSIIISVITTAVILLPLIVTTLNHQLGSIGASIIISSPVIVVVESFSFTSSYSKSRTTTRVVARATSPTTTTARKLKSSSTDNTDTDTDADADADASFSPSPSTISFGSTLNDEEEKEEAYIKSIQYGNDTIKNGYSGMTSGGYSPFLDKGEYSTPKWIQPTTKFFNRRKERKDAIATKLTEMNEDGYGEMRGSSSQRIGRNNSKRSFYLKSIIKKPFRKLKKLITKDKTEPGTLILVRHGESEWNKNKTFTGWADPDLTIQGYREVEHAARLLMEGGYHYDIHVVFTSRLKRAIRSTWILLQEFNEVYLPVFKSWRLNGMI
jgi:hypothetical protein